jgi:hypothetical protein
VVGGGGGGAGGVVGYGKSQHSSPIREHRGRGFAVVWFAGCCVSRLARFASCYGKDSWNVSEGHYAKDIRDY